LIMLTVEIARLRLTNKCGPSTGRNFGVNSFF
jgi:hypothetical protein